MSQFNFNAPWDPLRSVWVGATYNSEFYEPIRNSRVRDNLQKIAQETEEDYQYIIKILKSLNIEVQRPTVNSLSTIMDFVDIEGQVNYGSSKSFTLIPRPPMQPRDSILVVGDQMLATAAEAKCFYPDITVESREFDAPLCTVIGKHIIVDCRENLWLADYIQQRFPEHTIVPVMIGGHNDAVFCPVAPGLIVSTYHHDNYSETFPNWEIKYIENQSWNAIPGWRQYKHSNVNKWWIPDSDNNPEFTNFIDTWLDHWMGYVKETVFDVNMLQIDSQTILVNNHNKEMFEWFASKHIEPIIVPFRHRFFWDGGIHCITSDIYREGVCCGYI